MSISAKLRRHAPRSQDRLTTLSGVISRRLFIPLAVALVSVEVLLDQLTKEWALNRLGDGSRIDVLPTLEFDLSFNSGFSFSTGSGQGRLIGVGVIFLTLFLIRQITIEAPNLRSWLLTVILGGALGNLGDRIFRADDGALSGHVIDFIDVSWFAVFNVADIFVVGGAIILVLVEFLRSRQLDLEVNQELSQVLD